MKDYALEEMVSGMSSKNNEEEYLSDQNILILNVNIFHSHSE